MVPEGEGDGVTGLNKSPSHDTGEKQTGEPSKLRMTACKMEVIQEQQRQQDQLSPINIKKEQTKRTSKW